MFSKVSSIVIGLSKFSSELTFEKIYLSAGICASLSCTLHACVCVSMCVCMWVRVSVYVCMCECVGGGVLLGCRDVKVRTVGREKNRE